jgi:anti-sigma factor RsiW
MENQRAHDQEVTWMGQSARCEERLLELVDGDLPTDEIARLARADAVLRLVAGGQRSEPRDCARMRLWISATLDGELSELEAIRVREHVAHCPTCSAFKASLERVVTALRTGQGVRGTACESSS